MKQRHLQSASLSALGALFAFMWSSFAAQATLVSNTADSGPGSLRAALAAATNGDTITFAENVTGIITLTTGELMVDQSVNIRGPGPAILAVNGNFPNTTNRVFDVHQSDLTVTIAGLTITNGNFPGGSGGGIYNFQSTLTVSNCIITASSARNGGGIYNNNSGGHGALTVNACVLSSNTASYGGGLFNDGVSGNAGAGMTGTSVRGNTAAYGGGLYNGGFGSGAAFVGLSGCTISGNVAVYDPVVAGGLGGGIYNDGHSSGSAQVNVDQCTLSSNSVGAIYNYGYQGDGRVNVVTSTFSDNSYGAIYNNGYQGIAEVTVNASTFSGNSGAAGSAGINSYYSTTVIGDSILKGGGAGTNLAATGYLINSYGFNLCSDGGGGFLFGTNDQINTDPMLGPLQDNGGPTPTMALLPNSPAIDQGKLDAFPPAALNTDQRGVPRPLDFPSITNAPGGDASDIGAFESVPPAQFLSITPLTNSVQLRGAGISNFTYTIQAAPNLNPVVQWTNLGASTANSNGTFLLTDTNAARFPQRFYRAVWP
jgi:hypothetical protein